MFSLLIDKLPFFAAIVNHSYFYFLYFYHISDKRCRIADWPTSFCYIFHLTDMIILHILKVNRKLALFQKEC